MGVCTYDKNGAVQGYRGRGTASKVSAQIMHGQLYPSWSAFMHCATSSWAGWVHGLPSPSKLFSA